MTEVFFIFFKPMKRIPLCKYALPIIIQLDTGVVKKEERTKFALICFSELINSEKQTPKYTHNTNTQPSNHTYKYKKYIRTPEPT